MVSLKQKTWMSKTKNKTVIMDFNIEKLNTFAKPRSEKAIERARKRKENREWLRLSQDIALAIHYYIRKSGMTQKEFAKQMNVSAAYVGKLLKGGENLTLETICKIQNVIGEKIISVDRPYVSYIVTLPAYSSITILSFSSKAAMSEKYSERQSNRNNFITAAIDAA